MAVKKTTKSGGAPKAAPKAAAAQAAPKQDTAARAKAAAPKVPAPKSAAPKGAAAKGSAPKGAAAQATGPKGSAPKKKPAPVKLNERQAELLKKVREAQEGYTAGKGEAKSIESLLTRKLIKRGAKDKESGHYRFSTSRAGEKHLDTPPAKND